MFRLSLFTGLTWKPKELLLLRCDADVVAECAIAMKARRGLMPKTSAVKAVWHPQEGSSQAGRGPAQEAAAAGIRGATAKEEISARGGTPARNVPIRAGAGGRGGGSGAATPVRAAAGGEGGSPPPRPKAPAA